jgi:Zn-dependent M28 family amino/carboxypeptidase
MLKAILLIFVAVFLIGILLLWYYLTTPLLFGKKKLTNIAQIPVQKDRLYADVKFLTELNPPRNHENQESLEQCINHFLTEFNRLNLPTEIQTFQTPNKQYYKNVIATYNPDKKERLIIGAHYDVCGNQPGADDNASAVAGLLEIARLLVALKPDLPYRIDLVAFPLEEPPYFTTEFMGSAIHAHSLKENKIKVKAMVCLEMLGYFSDKPNSQEYPLSGLKAIYPSVANFIAVVGKVGENYLTGHFKKCMSAASLLPVYSINAPSSIRGLDFSDHRNYWAEGFPAVMITDTSFFRNPHYHQNTDTIETLDFDSMTEVVRGVYSAVVSF